MLSLGEWFAAGALACLVALLCWPLLRIGTYYVEYDGEWFCVFERRAFGIDTCRACYRDFGQAVRYVRRLRRDGPRRIEV